MHEVIERICQLQPEYSATNTPEMQERGRLVRSDLKARVEKLGPSLAAALGPFGSDLSVDASDGIGRKTELPWVRIYSRSMSPTPTEGFYCVIHFSTDGSAVHVTVGCGSSRFHKGSSVPLPDHELDAQTAWARKVVTDAFGTLAPFDDPAEFVCNNGQQPSLIASPMRIYAPLTSATCSNRPLDVSAPSTPPKPLDAT